MVVNDHFLFTKLMEYIFILISAVLFIVVVVLLLQKAKAVARKDYDMLVQSKQELEIAYAKAQQFAELQQKEKEENKWL